MAASAWKGFISFGLISVPIRLFTAARSSHVAFHEIHKECGTRVHQQLYCPYDKRVVSRDEIAMGYEIDEDKYVLVEPAELKKMQPKSSSAMEITQFVKLNDVDPMYFETSYFVVPEEAGRRAYTLLYTTMKNLEYAAIAQVTMHQREQVVILRAYENGLALHTMYYPDEIRQVEEFRTDTSIVKPKELEMAKALIESLADTFDPARYKDDYKEAVMKVVQAKIDGEVIEAPAAPQTAKVMDLMEALRASVEQAKKSRKTGGREAPAVEAKKARRKAS